MQKEIEKQKKIVDELQAEISFCASKLEELERNYTLEKKTLDSYIDLKQKIESKINPHDLYDEERDYQHQKEIYG